MALLKLTPLSALRLSKYQIPRYKLYPNTSIQNKPLLIYHACVSASAAASEIESHLKSVGEVTPQWRYTMFDFSHFHSTSHEVLCICSGRAKLCFGHESNPSKVEIVVEKGDVIIIPAGVGHRLLDDFESGFQMIGSYPNGVSYDMCSGQSGEEKKVEAIAKLSWFERDPVYGDEGPALDV